MKAHLEIYYFLSELLSGRQRSVSSGHKGPTETLVSQNPEEDREIFRFFHVHVNKISQTEQGF